jgi:hypothetical protein
MRSYFDLKEKLAELYLKPDLWEQFARACGLRPEKMVLGPPASSAFTTILEALDTPEKQDGLRAVLRRDLPELADLAERALVELEECLWSHRRPPKRSAIPKPPDFYAEPEYIASNVFVGRDDQLSDLNGWATPSDSDPVLLFEAIGGMGKSMLTWQWVRNRSTRVRDDWAGRFWYSFYERGAQFSDFLQHALAYVTGEPLDGFRAMKSRELGSQLVSRLKERPWLLVLDGLERVLVAYHRIDSAELRDEVADSATDEIGRRNPCASIKDEDDEVLKALTSASPSKLLISSRLTPLVLLNKARQPIPGVRKIELRGLDPEDAEALFRSYGIRGNSSTVRDFLHRHCDCHPLVIGILAGLVNGFMRDRGNFDSWLLNTTLDFSKLDLVQKRNHILKAALKALPENSWKVLSMLGLLPGAVDYQTLEALNPLRPPEPEMVEEPVLNLDFIDDLSWAERQRRQHEDDHRRSEEHRRAVAIWRQSPEVANARENLDDSMRDLERRGLLQYDSSFRCYDLHPVVRGVVVGTMGQRDTQQVGTRLIDYYSQQVHQSYFDAVSLEDLQAPLTLIRTLLKMGEFERACNAYLGKICNVLDRNLEAYAEALVIQRPFFSKGWGQLPDLVSKREALHLAHHATSALAYIGQSQEALQLAHAALECSLADRDLHEVQRALVFIADRSWIATADRLASYAHEISILLQDKSLIFLRTMDRFLIRTVTGQFEEAEVLWSVLNSMDREWSWNRYRPGTLERRYAALQLSKGLLTEPLLLQAEELAALGKSRDNIERLHALRGRWHLTRGEWEAASTSLTRAIQMCREVGSASATYEAQLALTKLNLFGDRVAAKTNAEALAAMKKPPNLALGQLWLALGERREAEQSATAAYIESWADGEPYVYRHELNEARAILEELQAPVPNLPAHDAAKHPPFSWEADLASVIRDRRREIGTSDI